MGQAKIQPSRARRTFNGWCHGLFAGQHFDRVLNLGCGHDVDRQGFTYSGYFDAVEVIKVDPEEHTTYQEYEQCICGGVGAYKNPVNITAKAEDLPFPENYFDMVFCNWVIYHTDYIKAISEICRVLVPNGKLFVSYMDVEQYGPIYKAVLESFDLIAYSYLHMDRELDGRDWVAEAIWGMRKEANV